jgi:hypothetical protein
MLMIKLIFTTKIKTFPRALPVAMNVRRGSMASGNLSVVMAAMSKPIPPVVLLFLLQWHEIGFRRDGNGRKLSRAGA